MGKDAKVKGKTSAKKVKGRKRTAEKQELTDSLRNTVIFYATALDLQQMPRLSKTFAKPRAFVAFGKDLLFSLTKWSY